MVLLAVYSCIVVSVCLYKLIKIEDIYWFEHRENKADVYPFRAEQIAEKRKAYYPSDDQNKTDNGFIESQFDLTPPKGEKDGFNF
jgi:hypothetical protein